MKLLTLKRTLGVVIYLLLLIAPISVVYAQTVETMQAKMFTYHKFEETSGTNVKDEVDGGTRNGTLDQAATNEWGRPGKLGNAIYFDATNALVDVVDAYDTVMTGDFSIEYWVSVNDTGAAGYVWSFRESGVVTGDYESAATRFHYELGSEDINTGSVSGKTWYHVMVTYDAGVSSKIYLNGDLTDTGSAGGHRAKDEDNAMGGQWNRGSLFFGLVDNLIVYNASLSWDEVNFSYNSGAGREYFVGDDTDPPILSGYNVTSAPDGCEEWNTGGTCNEDVDNTSTITFDTDENAWCAITTSNGLGNVNYTVMTSARNCSAGEGTTSHGCTVTAADAISPGLNNIFIGCKDADGNMGNDTNQNVSNSGKLPIFFRYRIAGTVIDAESSGVPTANVSILYAGNGSLLYHTVTNSSGGFENYTTFEGDIIAVAWKNDTAGTDSSYENTQT